jgi:Cupredoxin-like domain
VAALAVALAGCSHAVTAGSNRTVYVAVTEYRLTPNSIRVAGPGVLTIVVHNYGRLTHNLIVSQQGQVVYGASSLWPGQSAEVALNLAPGSYQMASTILNDPALGAYGTLTVTSG